MTLQQWKTPDSYAGFSPTGDYGVYSRHRDSDTLTNSNWECIWKFLKGAEQSYPFEPTQDDKYEKDWHGDSTAPGSWVYQWTASHWAVGWVEYMMLREDAPPELIAIVEEVKHDLDGYPVFDDDHYSQMSWDIKCEYWENMSIKERMYYCKQADVSIFAARRNIIPEDVDQYIED